MERNINYRRAKGSSVKATWQLQGDILVSYLQWSTIELVYKEKETHNHFNDILFQIPNNGLTNKLPAKEDIIQLAHVTIGRSQAKSLPVSFLQKET